MCAEFNLTSNHQSSPAWSSWNKEVTKRNGQSFYFASHILRSEQRRRAYQVYALCRIIDDATDEHLVSDAVAAQNVASGPAGSEISQALTGLLFSGKPILTVQHENPSFWFELKKIVSHALGLSSSVVADTDLVSYLEDMAHACQSMHLLPEHLEALVLGQKSDEGFMQPAGFQDFYTYCYRVAGVVGLVMAKVFGAKEDLQTLRAAEHLGIAMQITNILRDIKEDFEDKQRVYIPADLLKKFPCNLRLLLEQPSLAHGAPNFEQLVHEMAQWGITYYQSALSGVAGIPSFRARVCVKAMAAIYSAILAKIYFFPLLPLTKRVVVSPLRKVTIFLCVLFGRSPLAAAGFNIASLRRVRMHNISKLTFNVLLGKPVEQQ